MSLRYVFSPKARADLQAILDYSYERWGNARTLAYIDDLQSRVTWLAQNPALGRSRDELAPGVRSYPQGRHVLYYIVAGDELVVLRVHHQSAEPLGKAEAFP